MNNFGFIITRHVHSEKTNKYWNHSVKLLRTFYPHKKIVIIDDNSDQTFVKSELEYKNVQIIQSEFPKRGELLPYYYYLKHKFFENAIILHDSVFFHKRIHFEKYIGTNVLPLWVFHQDKENMYNIMRIANSLKNANEIISTLFSTNFMFHKKKTYGCFGVQSFINHSFLTYLNQKYTLVNLVKEVNCRRDRCSLERIMGCIFFLESNHSQYGKSLFGDIFHYQTWGYTYDEYMNDLKKRKIPRPIIKIWTGR